MAKSVKKASTSPDSTKHSGKAKPVKKALPSSDSSKKTEEATMDASLNKDFLQLRDDLLARKGQVAFFLKTFTAMVTDSSSSHVWPTEWEIYQGMKLAEDTLNKMVERIEEIAL